MATRHERIDERKVGKMLASRLAPHASAHPREKNTGTAPSRVTRGAHERTDGRPRRTVASLALAASLLGPWPAGPAEATTPLFVSAPNPFHLTEVGAYAKPALGDVDGDGDLDAFIGNGDGDTVFFANTGTASKADFAASVRNPFGLANVGTGAAPELADVDGDGDLDLFVGNERGDVRFFENIGTAATPSFAASTQNPFGLTAVRGSAVPSLGDIDGDGDLDALIGDGLGSSHFFENIGSASAPAFGLVAVDPFGLMNVGPFASPKLADLDVDGDLDVLIGDGVGSLLFFENTGTAAAPAFAALQHGPFGLADVRGFATPGLADIDGDGDPDALVGDVHGNVHLFENDARPAPAFAAPTPNPFGLSDVGQEAAPELTDIDGDGDLDAFIGQLGGNTRFFENTGTASAPVFAAFVQNPFGLANVDRLAGPEFADVDGDGDLDAFIGNVAGDTRFFQNIGTATAPAFAASVQNPFGLANVGTVAKPELADVDGDGDLDVFIGNGSGDTLFFRNIGTATVPAFAAFVQNPFGLGNVGKRAAPGLVDVDGDGDLDAIVGNSVGRTALFENTGSSSVPVFAASVEDPFGLNDVGFDAVPAFADIDDDGDLDAFVGSAVGTTFFFENVGGRTPGFAVFPPNPFGITDVGSLAAPALADVDADGDLDAFVGDGGGNTNYFENTGTPSAPAFSPPRENAFGLSPVSHDAVPELVDIDGDGDLDAFIGSGGGDTRFFENTGTAGTPAFTSRGQNVFGLVDVGFAASPDLADIDGDGDYDAFIGNLQGNVAFLENTGTTAAPAFAAGVTNPFGLAAVGFAAAPELADIDGDGDLDALLGNGDGETFFFENTGTTSSPAFARPVTNAFGLRQLYSFAVPALADIDGDGDLDALIGNAEEGLFFFENVPATCPSEPERTCITGFEKGQLVVVEKKAGKEKLIAKLSKGPALEQADFGDPHVPGGTAYALCLYDDQDERIATLAVDRAGESCGTKPCWKSLGGEPPDGSGHLFKDRDAASSGVVLMKLKGGDAGKSSLLVKARNDAASGQAAMPTGVVDALAGTARVELQMRTAGGECFAVMLDEVTEKSGVFKAK